MAETIGQRIRRLRISKGWSQDELAVYAHVARATLVSAEKDQNVRLDNLESIANTLGVSREYLLTGIDPLREGGWQTPEIALRTTTTLSEDDIQTLVRLIRALESEAERDLNG